jgi:hypothetical protein
MNLGDTGHEVQELKMCRVTRNANAETQRRDDVIRRCKGTLVVDNPLSIKLCHVGWICIDDGGVSFLRRIIFLAGRSGVFALAALADFRGVVVKRQWSAERRAVSNRTIDPVRMSIQGFFGRVFR